MKCQFATLQGECVDQATPGYEFCPRHQSGFAAGSARFGQGYIMHKLDGMDRLVAALERIAVAMERKNR